MADLVLDRPVALVGLAGVGKTTVGRQLARQLGVPFVDLDQEVERAEGALVPELFERLGEVGFRQAESRELLAALARGPAVVATGGGVVEREVNRRALAGGAVVVRLRADLGQLLQRLESSPVERPLLRGGARAALEAQAARRDPLYAEVAHLEVDVTRRSAREAAGDVVRALRGWHEGARAGVRS